MPLGIFPRGGNNMLRKSRFIGLALNNKLSGASLVYYEMLPTVNVSSFEGSRQKGGFLFPMLWTWLACGFSECLPVEVVLSFQCLENLAGRYDSHESLVIVALHGFQFYVQFVLFFIALRQAQSLVVSTTR